MGVKGVAISRVMTNLNMAVMLAAYVYVKEREKGKIKKWWNWGIKVVGFESVKPLMRLAIPNYLGIRLEWWTGGGIRLLLFFLGICLI